MDQSTYRDMHLLNEVTHSPEATQRELSHRIGAALGLTNLMLRRLAKKGYIKIINAKRSRIRYLITPQGILEKSRLTYAYVQHSLSLYSRVRGFLREQLAALAAAGHRRILLYGTGELAEIAFLTIHEMGLGLVGVVDESPDRTQFLGHPVRSVTEVPSDAYDRLIIASLRWEENEVPRLVANGVPTERILTLPRAGFVPPLPEASRTTPVESPRTFEAEPATSRAA